MFTLLSCNITGNQKEISGLVQSPAKHECEYDDSSTESIKSLIQDHMELKLYLCLHEIQQIFERYSGVSVSHWLSLKQRGFTYISKYCFWGVRRGCGANP